MKKYGVLGDGVDKVDYLIYLLREIWRRQKSKYHASNGSAGIRDAGSERTCSEGILEKREKAARARSGLCLLPIPILILESERTHA